MASKWVETCKKIVNEATISRIPVSGFFELTARCNFHCKMCYICSLPDDKTFFEKELTSEQWINLGREARDAGLFFLTLSGGELFIRKDFWEIYDAFSEMGFCLTLFTNGSLITPEKARRLGRKPPNKVSITLYGSSADTYGKVTGHPEAFESTISAIQALLSEGIKVELKTTVIKENSNEFEKLAEMTQKMGITIGIVNYVSPRREGCGTDPESCRLNPGELAEYEKKIQNYNLQLKSLKKENEDITLKIDEDTMKDSLSDDLKGVTGINSISNAFRCISGKCGFWLTWDGKLTPCGLLDTPYSKPLEVGFLNAWESLKVMCNDVPVCAECESCNIRSKCMTCPARLKKETGYFDKPAPYLCELAKARSILGVHY